MLTPSDTCTNEISTSVNNYSLSQRSNLIKSLSARLDQQFNLKEKQNVYFTHVISGCP